MKQYLFFLLFLIFTIISCNPKIDSETYSQYQERGNEISNLAQATLLANVGKAIQTGGTEYAVEFCNLKASSLIYSLNQVNNCIIARVSEKNRSPENFLKGEQEMVLWSIFKNTNQKDTVIQYGKNLIFYKRINAALPACLNCHGNPGSDINQATLDKIWELHPDDKATGYSLSDFRGLWKIEFKLN